MNRTWRWPLSGMSDTDSLDAGFPPVEHEGVHHTSIDFDRVAVHTQKLTHIPSTSFVPVFQERDASASCPKRAANVIGKLETLIGGKPLKEISMKKVPDERDEPEAQSPLSPLDRDERNMSLHPPYRHDSDVLLASPTSRHTQKVSGLDR